MKGPSTYKRIGSMETPTVNVPKIEFEALEVQGLDLILETIKESRPEPPVINIELGKLVDILDEIRATIEVLPPPNIKVENKVEPQPTPEVQVKVVPMPMPRSLWVLVGLAYVLIILGQINDFIPFIR